MSSPRSSSLSPSSSPLTITSSPLSSSMTNTLTPPSASSSEATVVSPEEFDMDQIMAEFPEVEMVEYHDVQRDQVVSPSTTSKAIVLYKPPKAQNLENLQERLEEVVMKVVREAADELIKLADGDIKKERKQQETSDSTKEHGERMTVTPQQASTHHESPMQQEASDSMKEHVEPIAVTPQQAPTHHESPKQEVASDSMKEHGELRTVTPQQAPTDHHESPKITETKPAVTRRQAQLSTKLVAQIPNVSFEIPDEVKLDDDIINMLVPKDEDLKNITAQIGKKYSFYDRLHGWKMECRKRLNGTRQYDKYYTHLQSKTVTRSVPEVIRFILYEVSPKQMRGVNKKRKIVDFWMETPETSSQNLLPDEDLSMEGFATVLEDRPEESYNEMWYRIAWENFVNGTAIAAPSEEKWEAMKAAKLKAKCKHGDCTPKPDVEAANALIGLAGEEDVARKRQKASN